MLITSNFAFASAKHQSIAGETGAPLLRIQRKCSRCCDEPCGVLLLVLNLSVRFCTVEKQRLVDRFWCDLCLRLWFLGVSVDLPLSMQATHVCCLSVPVYPSKQVVACVSQL